MMSDKDALLLCAHALPNADIWNEIGSEKTIKIHEQACKELACLEGELLEYQKNTGEAEASLRSVSLNDDFDSGVIIANRRIALLESAIVAHLYATANSISTMTRTEKALYDLVSHLANEGASKDVKK